eukprot:TRINITY_DN2648_c0_g1_i2.p2 TRINITY_DN2648_c0_g1~~TRINITY_DN2648_c0_g1_i2.p2  ORF type:complete len:275 (-),score=76.53 TRINITY_DN2648_c0_g1_i2:60-884(-)
MASLAAPDAGRVRLPFVDVPEESNILPACSELARMAPDAAPPEKKRRVRAPRSALPAGTGTCEGVPPPAAGAKTRGRPKGSGKCRACGKPGHNRLTCTMLADNSHKCAALAAAASGKRRGGFKAAPASLPPAVSSRVSPLPPQPQPLPLPQLLAVPVPVRVRVPAAAVAAQLQSQQQQPHHGFRQYAPLALARQPEPLPHLLPYLHEQLNADRSPSPPRKRSAPLPLADLLLPPPPEKRPAAEDDLQQPPLPPSATTPPLRSADTTHGATLPFL